MNNCIQQPYVGEAADTAKVINLDWTRADVEKIVIELADGTAFNEDDANPSDSLYIDPTWPACLTRPKVHPKCSGFQTQFVPTWFK